MGERDDVSRQRRIGGYSKRSLRSSESAGVVFARTPTSRERGIEAEMVLTRMRPSAAGPGLPASVYHQRWQKHSDRSRANARIATTSATIHARILVTCGARCVQAELPAIGECQRARAPTILLRLAGLAGSRAGASIAPRSLAY